MMEKIIVIMICLIIMTLGKNVRVEGRAQAYVGDDGLSMAVITILELDVQIQANMKGYFSFEVPVGQAVTLYVEYDGYHATQTSAVVVPPGGLVGDQLALMLQVPQDWVWDLFS